MTGKHLDLSKYDGKHVRIADIYGETFTGMAHYGVYEFLMHEYGGDEDGLFIEDYLIYNSQIALIDEIEVHGTVELWTERMTLRRYRPEDAEPLYLRLGNRSGNVQALRLESLRDFGNGAGNCGPVHRRL